MSVSARRVAVLGALLGTFASAYLLIDYLFGSGICLTGSGCDEVRASAFAYPLGIPMPLLGLGFYLAALGMVLAATAWFPAWIGREAALVIWSAAGVAVMGALTLIELLVIRAFCTWCLLSAMASLLLAIGSIIGWRARSSAQADVGSRSRRAQRRERDGRLAQERAIRRFTLGTGALLSVAFIGLLVVPSLSAPISGGTGLARPGRPTIGDGPVQVVVFSDFQCPACAAVAPVLRQLAGDGSTTLTYRFFPLTTIHPNAAAAARAAEAADLQGKFWEYHDRLFAAQSSWADLDAPSAAAWFASVARKLGLDMDRWQADQSSPQVAGIVDADAGEAADLQLRGTPTIYIGGTVYTGSLDAAGLGAAIRDAAGI
jgi:protein-disulfide isomerase/uncharacterized membrane protein